MKMAAVSSIALLLLCCSLSTSADPQHGCDYYVATNDNFSVPLHYRLNPWEDLRWLHGKSVIFSRRQTTVDRGKRTDVDEDGSLRLVNVDKSKAGSYTPEVFLDKKKRGNLKTIMLCVEERVPTPQVKIQCLSSAVRFTCYVDQPVKDLSFEWLQNNKVLENVTSQTLLANTSKEVEKDSVSCKVSNRVSATKSLPVKQNCIKTGFRDLFERFGSNVWIFVGAGGGVVLVLVVAVIVCCNKNRRKKRSQVKDEEELRLGWTNPSHQHLHHHHTPAGHCHDHHTPTRLHHHYHHQHLQRQPAGHTGPRQHRSKQQCSQQHPRDPDPPTGDPPTSSKRPAQGSRLANKNVEHHPPLPKPRKKTLNTPRA